MTADVHQKLWRLENAGKQDEKKKYQTKILSTLKISFKYEGKIDTFSDTRKLREIHF